MRKLLTDQIHQIQMRPWRSDKLGLTHRFMVSEKLSKVLVSSGSGKIARRQYQGSIMSYKILKVFVRIAEISRVKITLIILMISSNGK